MNFRWLWERQLNILIQVEKFWSYFAKSCDLCLSTSKPKIEQEVLSSESESSDLKNHPKVHLIDAPVEISSTFIRKSIKEGKNIQPLYRLKFGNILIIIIFTKIITPIQFSLQLLSLESAGKIVILPDNRKLPYVAFACYPKLFSVFYLE
jgi:hypothetical protein